MTWPFNLFYISWLGVCLLGLTVEQCDTDTFTKNCASWIRTILHIIQVIRQSRAQTTRLSTKVQSSQGYRFSPALLHNWTWNKGPSGQPVIFLRHPKWNVICPRWLGAARVQPCPETMGSFISRADYWGHLDYGDSITVRLIVILLQCCGNFYFTQFQKICHYTKYLLTSISTMYKAGQNVNIYWYL